MKNIFNSHLHLDFFYENILSAWINYRKLNNLPYTKDDWLEWVENDLESLLYITYDDFVGACDNQ